MINNSFFDNKSKNAIGIVVYNFMTKKLVLSV